MSESRKQQQRVFLSHSSADQSLAIDIAANLNKCVAGGVYCYENTTKASFPAEMSAELHRCTHMLVLVGEVESEHQNNEVQAFYAAKSDLAYWFIVDCRTKRDDLLPKRFALCEGITKYRCDSANIAASALDAAQEAARTFGFPFYGCDRLPANPHLFDYEKDIIDFYTRLQASTQPQAESLHKKLLDGTPPQWPSVHELKFEEEKPRKNPDELQELVGEWRDPNDRVLVAALSKYHDDDGDTCPTLVCPLKNGFCFPEAGPRKEHIYPKKDNALRVGIVVSGGIAPGINAVIDGITKRHYLYADFNKYKVDVVGILNGFRAFDHSAEQVKLVPNGKNSDPNSKVTADFVNLGGTILGTSRVNAFIDPQKRKKAIESFIDQVYRWQLDILYVIGGDGSMKAAHAIWSCAQEYANRKGIARSLSVVGVPKTMDNDILWVWQSFGFLSAVEKAREVIQHLHTEISSCPRLCIVQLFGSDSGFVVSHAVLASQTEACDAALIPEVPFSMNNLAEHIMYRMAGRRSPRGGQMPAGLIVIAETAIPEDAGNFIDDDDIRLLPEEKEALRGYLTLRDAGCRIQGHTNEALRAAGLKIVSRGLDKLIKSGTIRVKGNFMQPNWQQLEIITNEPRHLLRAIPPSCMDVISGQRLGTLAVDNALAGYTDFMISQWLTEYVLVPLDLVVLGRKRIPRKGVFWRSVKAKTGQNTFSQKKAGAQNDSA